MGTESETLRRVIGNGHLAEIGKNSTPLHGAKIAKPPFSAKAKQQSALTRPLTESASPQGPERRDTMSNHIPDSVSELQTDFRRKGQPALFTTTVAGVGPYCIEFADGEIITTRTEERQKLIAAAYLMANACKAAVTSLRTFRNVPQKEQQWTGYDDDVMSELEAALAAAGSY